MCCRVGATLVHKAWLRAEAAHPVQHTELTLRRCFRYRHPSYPEDISRLRWDFRDASQLLGLHLGSKYVAIFLTLQPKLTRLERLTIRDWEYTNEQAEQLLCIQSLETLQVCYLLECFSSISQNVCLYTVHTLSNH